MSATDSLTARIDAEFAAFDERLKRDQEARVREFRERQERVAALGPRMEQLSAIWKPRLEALAQRLGDLVKVTPSIQGGRRDAHFSVQSDVAKVDLRLAVASDAEARNLTFSYDLHILPVLTQFEKHSQIEFPIDRVDEEALARWIEDRILGFVRTYLSLQENEYYLKDQTVIDPVAGVSFPKHAAGATLERDGKTYYFIGEETRREFEQRQAATASS